MKRKERARAPFENEIPAYDAYGFSIAEQDVSKLPDDAQRRMMAMRRMREIVERYDAVAGKQPS